jgi:TPR repeat protein
MFYLASCYGEGQLGLQVDHERAFNLYQSAAKLNHAPSAYRTAGTYPLPPHLYLLTSQTVCCELGAGVRKDPQRAMTWYKKAAALGETPAMFKLGMILWKGLLGQQRNPRDGLIWLKRAADQADENNQHALHELGMLYESEGSDVVIPDKDYARELYLRAAELGYAASQFRMGCAYEYGNLGCPVDPRKSIAWYSKAAMKGDHAAQLALSGWYLTGAEGIIQQSDTEAYLWARKAAEMGLAKAEYALGYYTETGIGVAPNLDEAKRWYYKAASMFLPSQGHWMVLKTDTTKASNIRRL